MMRDQVTLWKCKDSQCSHVTKDGQCGIFGVPVEKMEAMLDTRTCALSGVP